MKIKTFSLPAGQTCPGADLCRSRAVKNKETGRTTVQDGPNTEFRCFAASQEAQYLTTYNARQHNLIELKKCKSTKQMVTLIEASL